MSGGQSKAGSLTEALTNILIGCVIAFTSQVVIFHFYGIEVPAVLNLKMTAWFTAVSLARSFLLRRMFNYYTHRLSAKLLRQWETQLERIER